MDDKKNTGITAGVAIGFMLGLLVNIVFLPLCIGAGGLFDIIKNRRDK